MNEPSPGRQSSKAERRAARAVVATYHEAKIAGEIDVFELDDLIHRYKRSARELWKFCVGGGAHVESAARTLEFLRQEGELPDWWERGAPRER